MRVVLAFLSLRRSCVNNLPSSCSRAQFRALLPSEGVRCVYFGDPLICPPPGLARFAWVTTDTVERAQQVCDLLQGEHEFTMNELKEEKGRMRLNVDLQAPLRRNSFLPFIANKPEHVTWDLANLKQLCRALEHYWLVPTSFVDTLAALETSNDLTDVDRVYVLVFFVRRVFGYDYWRHAADDGFGVSLQVGGGAGVSL